jgi:hypothetical protein
VRANATARSSLHGVIRARSYVHINLTGNRFLRRYFISAIIMAISRSRATPYTLHFRDCHGTGNHFKICLKALFEKHSPSFSRYHLPLSTLFIAFRNFFCLDGAFTHGLFFSGL